jgi:hypothetical protein
MTRLHLLLLITFYPICVPIIQNDLAHKKNYAMQCIRTPLLGTELRKSNWIQCKKWCSICIGQKSEQSKARWPSHNILKGRAYFPLEKSGVGLGRLVVEALWGAYFHFDLVLIYYNLHISARILLVYKFLWTLRCSLLLVTIPPDLMLSPSLNPLP